MKLPDKSRYVHLSERIGQFLDRNKEKDISGLVASIAVWAPCPVVTACQLVIDLRGSTPQLEEKMKSIKEFYHYE